MEIDEARTPDKWGKALRRALKAVVVLKVTTTRDFDTDVAHFSEATGFVVDKQRGIILTNRHVVHSGPVVADAAFLNREEIPVYPLYRDPVHDFGFYRFDPTKLRFAEPDEIPLAPEAAAVGLQIRVVGNDSGEKLSIMEGILAQLDREAPIYKADGYNDFNTFYMQAYLGTNGGSSGSPVIDCDGRAVGLNAGSKAKASIAFILPLDRVVRALKILQRCRDECESGWRAAHIPRGTLQMTLRRKRFDNAHGLGLQDDTEKLVRQAFPAEKGILVIKSVVPGGPAHENDLDTGDVLVRVNGEIVTHFLKLETVLDDSVGKAIDLELQRDGVPVKVTLEVQDLHSITPRSFLQVSGGVFHPLSYQQARNFSFKCDLVYVAKPGYMLSRAGVPPHAIIKKLAGKETKRIEDFISIFSKLPRGSRVQLEFVTHKEPRRSRSCPVTIDRHEWYEEPQLYTRDDATGLWKRTRAIISSTMASASDEHVGGMEVDSSKFSDNDGIMSDSQSVDSDSTTDDIRAKTKRRRLNDQDEAARIQASLAEQVIKASLVIVDVHVPPCTIPDGVRDERDPQTGVVVYHSKTMGIVAVDRNTVGTSVADVILYFAAWPIEIPGEVVFLHPLHNYAFIAYDPVALGPVGTEKVRAAALLPEPALSRGDVVYLVGLSTKLQASSRKSVVTNPDVPLNIDPDDTPRYRAINMDVIELDADFGDKFSGVLVDEQGRVQALWSTFDCPDGYRILGIPINVVSQVLDKIIHGGTAAGLRLLINGIPTRMPFVRILEVELYPILLSTAHRFGLSDKWITELVNKDPLRQHVLQVRCCFVGSRAEGKLEQGDMVLAIDGKPVTNYRDVENACQLLDAESNCKDGEGNLRMTILRQGREIEVVVGTDVRSGFGSTHMVGWCGCILHETHSAVRSTGFWPKEGHGVYLSTWIPGSPADRYGVSDTEWIVQVNGKPIPDLQTFLNVTKDFGHGKFVRIKTVDLAGIRSVFTLKQDLLYWPTWELQFDPETATWKRKIIKAVPGDA